MADHIHSAGSPHHHEHDHDTITPGSDTAECPVMGRLVVKAKAEAKGWVRHYAGRTYWLCCAGCVPTFDADPAKFAVA